MYMCAHVRIQLSLLWLSARSNSTQLLVILNLLTIATYQLIEQPAFLKTADKIKKNLTFHTKYVAFPKNIVAYGHSLCPVSSTAFQTSKLNAYIIVSHT